MCKCYNFILRRIHVYYQAVLWIRSMIDCSIRICLNKINSDRIICGYLGLRIFYSKTTLDMIIPLISAISLCHSLLKLHVQRAAF